VPPEPFFRRLSNRGIMTYKNGKKLTFV